MLYQVLFALVFVSQILVIQLYYSWKLTRLGQSESFTQWCVEVAGVKSSRHRSFGAYKFSNAVIAAIGVILLGAIFYHNLHGHMTQILLLIGAFFFLQILPLALPNMRRLWVFLRETSFQPGSDREVPYNSIPLLDFVSPLPVVIAIVLYSSYVIFNASQWTGELNTQVAKTLILTGSNLFFLVLVSRIVSQVKKPENENREQLYRNLFVVVPLFVYISIMLSIYYFAKELLFDNDLHLLRPAMMSAFLQILAILLFKILYLGGGPRQ